MENRKHGLGCVDLLRQAGPRVNVKRVQRLWREEGLKVPRKQYKK